MFGGHALIATILLTAAPEPTVVGVLEEFAREHGEPLLAQVRIASLHDAYGWRVAKPPIDRCRPSGPLPGFVRAAPQW